MRGSGDDDARRRRADRRTSWPRRAATPPSTIAGPAPSRSRVPGPRAASSAARSPSATTSSTTTGSPRRRRPTGRDGLGPLFNAQSCSSCHFQRRPRPAARRPPTTRSAGLLLRLSVPGADGDARCPTRLRRPAPGPGHPRRARRGHDRHHHASSSRARYADGTALLAGRAPPTRSSAPTASPLGDDLLISPRIAPAVFGVGLLEAVPDDGHRGAAPIPTTPTATASPGRRQPRAPTPTTGERGARPLRLEGQRAHGAGPERRRVRRRHRHHVVAPPRAALHRARRPSAWPRPTGGEPEIDDAQARPGHLLHPHPGRAGPARRRRAEPPTEGERAVRATLGCASLPHRRAAHRRRRTSPALADQIIRPYTDLLLHDMGPASPTAAPTARPPAASGARRRCGASASSRP